MNDELNTTNNMNQPAGAQPAANEVLTPEAQQPMVDPIEAPVEPEVKTTTEAGTFTPPVEGMVPTGWAFPQDLASSLAMTTEDPEVAATGVDEVNQPADDMDAGGPSDELPESVKSKKRWSSLRGLLREKKSKKLREGRIPYPDFLDPDRVPETIEEFIDALQHIDNDIGKVVWGEWDSDVSDDGGESDLEESTKKKLRKSKKLREEFDLGVEEEDEESDLEEMGEDPEEVEEPEDECESCEDLEENPEEIPDLLDVIADILRKKDLDDSDEFEDEDEPEAENFDGDDFPVEDLEMDEAVKYPAGSEPRQPAVARAAKELPENSFDQEDIIRQYEKRALARKALIEKLKKPLWEKELDEIADTDERDKEVGYKSIDDAIDEGSLSEKFDRALKNPLEESRKGATGWAAHNNLGRLSEKRLNFRKMVGKGFLD